MTIPIWAAILAPLVVVVAVLLAFDQGMKFGRVLERKRIAREYATDIVGVVAATLGERDAKRYAAKSAQPDATRH